MKFSQLLFAILCLFKVNIMLPNTFAGLRQEVFSSSGQAGAISTIKFSLELKTFQINDRDLNTNNVCEKSEQNFKMDDASVSHQPVYVSFLDDSPMC